jgi:hypothetical protein
MVDDNLEGQEVDLLIKELSTAPRKPVVPVTPAPKPAEPVTTASTAPAPAPVKSFGSGPLTPIPPMTSRKRRSFVSAISLPQLPALNLPRLTAPRGAVAVWLSVSLGVLLCSAMPYWPYPKGCSWWLLLYLLAVGMVFVTGIWNARLTWEARLGYAHTIAIAIVMWGVTLAAAETIPRVGHASTAVWLCP